MSKDTKYPMSSTNSRIQSLEKTIITLEEQIEKHKQEIINIKSKKSNRGIAIYLKLNPDIQDIIDKYVYMNNCDNKLELLTEYKCYCMSYSIIHSLWIKYPVNEKVVEYVGVGVWHHYPNYNANVIVNSINEDLLSYGFRISNFSGRKKQKCIDTAKGLIKDDNIWDKSNVNNGFITTFERKKRTNN